MGFRDYADSLKNKTTQTSDSVGFRKYAEKIQNQEMIRAFKSTVHSEEEHDAVMRHMYGSYGQYIAQQIEDNTSLSDDAKANLISYYGITESDTNRKTIQPQGGKETSTTQNVFRSLVKGVNDGSVKVSSNISDAEYTNWGNSVSDLVTRAYNYLKTDGYKQPDTALSEELDSYLCKTADIGQYIRANRLRYENYDQAYESYVNTVNSLRSLKKAIDNSNETFSQYESEDEYNKALQASKDYEIMLAYDVEAGKSEIEDLLNGDEMAALKRKSLELKEKIKELGASGNKGPGAIKKTSLQKELSEVNARIKEIEDTASKKKVYLNQAVNLQKGIKLAETALKAEDFEEKSKYVDTKKYGTNIFGVKILYEEDSTYEYINNVNGYREKYNDRQRIYSRDNPYSDDESYFESNGYDYLEAQEIAIYNYYYATEGKKKAEEYLDTIQETLNARKASADYSEYEGHTFKELVFGVEAGLDQFKSGMSNLFNTKDDYIPPSATQMMSGMVRDDLADDGFKIFGNSLGQVGYDFINTTSNMLPSILTSSVLSYINPALGATVGTGLMGASAAGNAYQEMLNLGYDKGRARTYSILVGGAEAGLQYLIGGIGKLGGKLTGKSLAAFASKVDNGIAKFAIKFGGSALSEGFEEAVQEVLSPLFQNIAASYNVNSFDDIKWDEVVYSALLGTLSGGLFEGAPSAISTYKESANAKKTYGSTTEDIQALIDEGLAMPKDSEAYRLAAKYKEQFNKNGKLSGTKLANLVNANEAAIVSGDVSKIRSAIEARLNELGETENITKLSDILVKKARGEKLFGYEAKTLENSRYGERVLNELSPKNIESGNYSSTWTESIGTDRINSDAYSRIEQQSHDSANIDGQASVGYNNGTNVNQNDNGGIGNGAQAFDNRGYSQGDRQRSETNTGAESKERRIRPENEEDFVRRVTGASQKNPRKIRRLGKTLFAYTPSEADGSEASKAVEYLKRAGIDAFYCEGSTESNKDGYTTEHNEATTSTDGKTFVSSNTTLSAVQIASHEAVHVKMYENAVEYAEYESVICDGLLWGTDEYAAVAKEIFEGYHRSKYEQEKGHALTDEEVDDIIRSPEYASDFLVEFTAFVNEVISANSTESIERFSKMFSDWDAVVEASKKFNEAIGLDFTDNDGNGGNSSGGEGSSLDASAKDSDIEFLKAPTSGRVLDMKPVSKQAQEYVIEIGKKLGRTVKFVDMEAELLKRGKDLSKFKRLPSAFYDTKTGEIYMGYQTDRPVQFLLKHEFTHFIQTKSGKYFDFQNKVFDSSAFKKWLKDKGYNNLRELVREKGYIYQGVWEESTAEIKAYEEILADFVGEKLFGNENSVSADFLQVLNEQEKRNFIQVILDFFKTLRSKLRGMEEIDNEIAEFEKNWQKLYRDVVEGINIKENTATSDDVIYSVSADYKQQVDNVLNNNYDKNNHVYMGNTPERLVRILGIQKLPMLVTNNHIYSMSVSKQRAMLEGRYNKNANYHDLGSVVKELPQLLDRPIMIIKSNTKSDDTAFVVVTNAVDKKGDPVIVAIKPNGKGFYYNVELESTTVLSAYGKESFSNYITTARNQGRILYANKSSQQTNIPGVQFPNNILSADYSNNLARFKQIVNNIFMQEGEKYSAQEFETTDDEEFFIAGPKSRTANFENLDKAKERDERLKDTKANSERTRRKYGWFRGLDRMWRYEISDKDAKINILTPEYKKLVDELNAIKMDNNSSFSVEALNRIDEIINSMTKVIKYRDVKTLGDILEHDRLYEAYPELADYKVEIVELENGEAEFDPKTQTIKINKNLISTIDTATIMHEVQHAIQDIEGFASGSSEAYWESIDKQHTEKLVEISETIKEIEARGGKKLVDLSLKYLDNFEKISNNDPNSEQLQREREEIEEQARRKGCYRLLKSLSVQRIEARALEKKLALFDSDYERYYNTAGEIEARNVEKRLDMTDDEREAERPDIDRKKVAFVESKFRAAKGESLDELAESKGYSQKLYHQTGSDFTVFDTEHQKAGKYDPEMPTGTFLKPDDSDIGLSGKKQMELFTKIKNPLEFKDRADAQRFWMRNIDGYAETLRTIDRINERYSREVARAGMEVSEYKKEWRRNNPDADNREIYNDAEFQRLDEAQDQIAREWDDRSNKASLEAKKLIDGYMLQSGYDGVVMENDIGSNGKSTKTYVVFDSSQMKSTDTVTYDDNGNEIPLSARFDDSNEDIRYSMSSNTSVDEVLRRLENKEITRDEARTLLSREKTLNPAQIANATENDASTTPPRKRNQGKNEGNRQSKFYESLMGSSIFDDTFKREAADNSFIQKYKSVTNEETLKEAAEELDNGGEAYVSRWWTIDQKRASLIDTAVGFILMDRYQRVGDYESAIAAAEKVRGFGTAQGQSVQIFSILSRLTPDTMVIYAQRELTKAFDVLQKKRAQKWIDENADKFNLTEDEIEYIRRRTLQAAQLPEGRDKSIRLAEIASLLQDKLPPEKGQGMKALQRVSMLLNPKTIERNIVSNLGMVPVFIASDFFGSGIDRIVSMKTGVRTTGNFDVKSAKGIVKGAWETMDDFRRHINTRNEELNRFEVGGLKLSGKAFNEHHTGKMAKQLNDCARVLNALDRFTSFCLELGDRPFYEMWYINSINNQLKLNKATEATPEMIQIACLEALQRTWQDTNKVVEAVSKLKNSVLNCVTINGYGLGDVMVKFVKTPANLTKAIVDFSPAGVVKAIAVDAKNMTEAIKKGQFEASLQKKFVDSLSKGIAGSLVYILTVALVKAGKISGAGDEDKDVSNFEKYILGIPEYSINLFGKWFSYDWMQPVGAVFATVSDYMKSKEEKPNSEWYENIVEAIRAGGEVLYNQSFMQSIQNLFTADNIIDGVIDSALDDPSVYVPQLVSQIANVTDEYRRVTYENGSPFKTALNKIKVKIPGWRQTLDRQVDVLGRDVPNSQHSVFNAFFNPGNTYTDTSNNIADEVYALYKRTGDATVIPRKAPYFIEKAEIKRQLTAEQTNDYQRMAGSVSSELLEVIFESEDYAKLDDDQKIYIVTAVYDYAARCAKSQLDIYDYEWLSAMEGNKSNGEPILSETTYKKLDDKAIQMLIDENFYTKAELKCKGDTELVAKLLIKKAKARE